MRSSDSRTQHGFPRTSLLWLAPLVLCSVQTSGTKPQATPFRFPDKKELRETHTGAPLADIGLNENEIDQLTGVIWDSGTIEPALPSDYELRGELLARRVNFDEGDDNGLVLQANKKFCDALGNCRTWFFRKAEGKWKSVANQRVEGEGVPVFDFAIQKAESKKLLNLVLIKHSIADNYPTRVWEPGDGEYTPKRFFCWHRASNSFETKPCVDFALPAQMHGSHQAAGISEGDLDDPTVAEIIARIVGKGGEDMPAAKDMEEELIATHLDFGEGAENGLVVQGSEKLCGATGNCQMWFFRKVAEKWLLIGIGGNDDETSASMFAAVPPKHGGLFEVILGSHLSSSEAAFGLFWFDGMNFVEHGTYCRYDETGEVLAGACE
jgi:hypothetical protein